VTAAVAFGITGFGAWCAFSMTLLYKLVGQRPSKDSVLLDTHSTFG
jgi:hypothetical protein